MARSEKPAAPQQRDAGVRERWTAERREQIAVYFLQVYATSRHLQAANFEAAELGYRRTSRRKREDSTGDRRCKGERTVPGVGSFQRVVRFLQMARRLGALDGQVNCLRVRAVRNPDRSLASERAAENRRPCSNPLHPRDICFAHSHQKRRAYRVLARIEKPSAARSTGSA